MRRSIKKIRVGTFKFKKNNRFGYIRIISIENDKVEYEYKYDGHNNWGKSLFSITMWERYIIKDLKVYLLTPEEEMELL